MRSDRGRDSILMNTVVRSQVTAPAETRLLCYRDTELSFGAGFQQLNTLHSIRFPVFSARLLFLFLTVLIEANHSYAWSMYTKVES